MIITRKLAQLVLAVTICFAFTSSPALAHSFNVVLVIDSVDSASNQGSELVDGFLLATAERDSHPSQESDGHLGGLDVYLTVIMVTSSPAKAIEEIVQNANIDIVAAMVREPVQAMISQGLDSENIAFLVPGKTPFSDSRRPGVAAFISAYESKYDTSPSLRAAQGYNAARRIDLAVRSQGGIESKALLLQSFMETESSFAW